MIYLDMDGVIADFHQSAFELHGRDYWHEFNDKGIQMPYRIWKELNISEEEFWVKIRNEKSSFWEFLPVTPWFEGLIHAIESTGSSWIILTSTRKCPYAATGKIRWMEHVFGRPPQFFLTQSQNKQRLAKPGDILIDDSDTNCIEFEQAGGRSITFPRPWNRMYSKAGGNDDGELTWVRYRLGELFTGA